MKKFSNNSLSMKNNLKSVLLLLLTVFIFSCSNEDDNMNETTDEISSVQYFESKTSFESKMKTIKTAEDNQTTDNEYNVLSEVLNKDNIVGIGEYFIKIDLNTESVYTLNTSYSNEYNDLANINLKNSNVSKFSIYSDVLSLLDGSITAERSSCGSAASFDYDSDTANGNNRSLFLSATYRAYGIYFMLSYRCVPSDGGYSRLDEWDTSYTTTSCTSYSSYGENDYGDGENEGSFGASVYFGTTPLANFHCFVVCSSSVGTVDVTIES